MNAARNFFELFAATAGRHAARVAVEVQRRDSLDRFTYAELRDMAARAAADLAGRGFCAGDRAAILADNGFRWCAGYFGVLQLGGVAVPLDTTYKAKQVATLLRDSGAKVVFAGSRYLDVAREAALYDGLTVRVVLLEGCGEGVACFDDVLIRPRTDDLPICPAAREDAAVLLYTSGTTSDPKGVLLTHANLLAEMDAVFTVIDISERDAILGVLPLFHALAQLANLLLPFSVGARVVYLESLNSAELLRALAERGVTLFCCVPQFFYLIHQRVQQQVAAGGFARRAAFRALLALNGWLREIAGVNIGPRVFRRVHDVLGRRMRLFVTGGSRFDPLISRDLYRLGFDLVQAYGLTESSGAATLVLPGSKYTDSVGPPLPGIEVKIAPPETTAGEQRPDEHAQDGEVLIRGPIVMQGYFNRPEVNAAALAGGWLHTGDLGYLDPEGLLHITGRSKEIIVLSSGKNIYPEEIEAHYLQSPYIKELCVMGRARPKEPAVERLHAVVLPDFELMRERKVVNTREILRFEMETLSVHLPSHKRILSYEIWTEELPRTTTRKLKRFEIERRAGRGAAPAESTARDARLSMSEEERAWSARPDVARALEVIRGVAQPGAVLRPGANIELELGLDSMERVELLTRLGAQFGASVPDEVAQRIYTVRELVEAVLPGGLTGSASGAGTPAGAGGDAWGALLAGARDDDTELAALLKPRPIFAAALFLAMKLVYVFARIVFRFRVEGREHLPQSGAFLLCPNHQSYLDPFFMTCALPFRVFRNIFLVGASEYFATPLTRWLARLLNLVPVDPDTNLLRAMQAGAFGLRHGKVLVLFPEGERSIDGAPKKFKKGAPILSMYLQAPIVPVALDGVFEIWPRGFAPRLRAFLPGKAGRVSLRFGAPLAPPARLPANTAPQQAESRYAADAEALRAVVLRMWQALREKA